MTLSHTRPAFLFGGPLSPLSLEIKVAGSLKRIWKVRAPGYSRRSPQHRFQFFLDICVLAKSGARWVWLVARVFLQTPGKPRNVWTLQRKWKKLILNHVSNHVVGLIFFNLKRSSGSIRLRPAFQSSSFWKTPIIGQTSTVVHRLT